jgi:Uma2 family endonuclease
MEMQMPSLLSAQGLAKKLNLSVPLLTSYTKCGLIPFAAQKESQYLYSLTAVQAALSQGVRELKADYSSKDPCTYQDYLSLPESMLRTEILDGVLIQEPAPIIKHQQVLARLFLPLSSYFSDKDPKGIVFVSPVDVTLSDTVVVQPDLLYVPSRHREIITKTRVNGPPDLAVEIISPSSIRRDRVVKLDIYQRFAIPHYWLVDALAETFEIYALSAEGIYRHRGEGNNGIFSIPGFPDLTLDLDALWA